MAVDTGERIRVEGLRETIKNLQALGAEKSEFVEINLEAAEILMSAARPLIPVKTGNLANSMRASKTANYAQIALGKAKVPYAGPVHWGWFYDRKNFIQKNIKPALFMPRALKANFQRIMSHYDSAMQRLLTKYELGE
jgi:hypothetical protein